MFKKKALLIKKSVAALAAFSVMLGTMNTALATQTATESDNTKATVATLTSSTQKVADLDVAVKVSDDLVVFTQNVTSNNSYLELIGASSPEELRTMMQGNNVYLEIIPKDVVNYEILLSGFKYGGDITNLSDLSGEELNSVFNDYTSQINKKNDTVEETLTASSIEKIGDVTYFAADITSVSASTLVKVYVRKYYTIVDGKVIVFTLQTNGLEITDGMNSYFMDIINSAEYKDIKKSILDNGLVSEILSSIITLGVPIGILALILYILSRPSKRRAVPVNRPVENNQNGNHKDTKENNSVKDSLNNNNQ